MYVVQLRQNAPCSRDLSKKWMVPLWSVLARRARRPWAPQMTSQHWRWKIEVRDSLVSFGAHGLRVRARRADHAERIHFFHRFREQGAFCRNSMFLFMSQKACMNSTRPIPIGGWAADKERPFSGHKRAYDSYPGIQYYWENPCTYVDSEMKTACTGCYSILRCSYIVHFIMWTIVIVIIVICPFVVSVLIRHRFVLKCHEVWGAILALFSSIVFSGGYFFAIVFYDLFSQYIAIPLSSDTAQYGSAWEAGVVILLGVRECAMWG